MGRIKASTLMGTDLPILARVLHNVRIVSFRLGKPCFVLAHYVFFSFWLTRASSASVMYVSTTFELSASAPAPEGSIVTVDTDTGQLLSVVGDVVTPGSLSGLDFNFAGQLFASTRDTGGVQSELVRVDPDTGLLLANLGPVRDSLGSEVGLSDLAFQPGTGTLYGTLTFGSPCVGCLWTIDTGSAVATLIGDPFGTGVRGGLAFHPDGTLFGVTNPTFDDPVLATIDPVTAAVLTSELAVLAEPFVFHGRLITTPNLDGLAVRSDGTLFATFASGNDVFGVRDSATGLWDFPGVGPILDRINNGIGTSVTDVAFRPAPAVVPEPNSLGLLAVGLVLSMVAKKT